MIKFECGTHDEVNDADDLYFYYKRALDNFRFRKLCDAVMSPQADCWR